MNAALGELKDRSIVWYRDELGNWRESVVVCKEDAGVWLQWMDHPTIFTKKTVYDPRDFSTTVCVTLAV